MNSNRDRTLKRMEEFLRCRLAEETAFLQHGQPKIHPSLTISREAGTDAEAIGEHLIEYLGQFDESAEHGWALFDQSLVTRVIEEHDLPASLSEHFQEEGRRPIHEAIKAILGPNPTDRTLFHYIADTIRKLCIMGNVIIIGRGGNLITRDLPNTFHVRLIGSESDRIESVSRSQRMSPSEAEQYVRQTDKARAAFVKDHLGSPIDDPADYHLVLNTDRINGELAARIIGDTLLEWLGNQNLDPRTAAA